MDFSFIEMWHAMGFVARLVVLILALMAVAVTGVSIERYRTFRNARKRADGFVKKLRAVFEQNAGKEMEAVSAMAKEHAGTPVAAVALTAVEAFARRDGHVDALDLVVGINRAVERSIERETSTLKWGLGGLATIATTAPFVGLFGTVIGIITAFQTMSSTGSGGLDAVAGGIAEALVATAFGLVVAIPAVGLYNYFSGVVDGFVIDMDEVASELVEVVLLRDVR